MMRRRPENARPVDEDDNLAYDSDSDEDEDHGGFELGEKVNAAGSNLCTIKTFKDMFDTPELELNPS